MAWIQKLNEAYEVISRLPQDPADNEVVLVPMGFVLKRITYLVTLSADGERAVHVRILGDKEQNCIVPSTPAAEARTGDKGALFPLAEQLKYLVTKKNAENPQLKKYIDQLKRWCEQSDAPECLCALCRYMERGALSEDIKTCIKGKNDAEKEKKIFDSKEFVCFAIESDTEMRMWMREDVKKSWEQYFGQSMTGKASLCYVTGQRLPIMDSHPKVTGNAKLISAKDAGFPFQYKGLFINDKESAKVSMEASIRAHKALDYLLDKQSFRRYGMKLVAWNTATGAMPVPVDEPNDTAEQDTFEEFGLAIKEASDGNRKRLENFEKSLKCAFGADSQRRLAEVVIMGMEAATDGRMSINYYQELDGETYIKRLTQWYETCQWEFLSPRAAIERTPSPLEIARAVMGQISVQRALADKKGEKSDAKQMRNLYKRLLSCIVDGASFPENLKNSAVHRASMPLSFTDNQDNWNRNFWELSVRVTCALIRRSYFDSCRGSAFSSSNNGERSDAPEKYSLHSRANKSLPDYRLDPDCADRSYLFGRLLAVADQLEVEAKEHKETNIPTNAIRMLQKYVQRPNETWCLLHAKLLPYLRILGRKQKAGWYQNVIGRIESTFRVADRSINQGLDERFLIGFYAQKRELKISKENRTVPNDRSCIYHPTGGRSELYGCLLAIADRVQWQAEAQKNGSSYESAHDGATQALLLSTKMLSAPCKTWRVLHEKLIPYLEKLGTTKAGFFLSMLSGIERLFDNESCICADSLDGMMLYGYYCMRRYLISGNAGPVMNEFVDDNTVSRESAYAQLLALENRVERTILDIEKEQGENRFSNAFRYIGKYEQMPDSTWTYLMEKMQPYRKKMQKYRPKLAARIEEKIAYLTKILEDNNWNSNQPLNDSWIHSYYQFYYIKEKKHDCIKSQD